MGLKGGIHPDDGKRFSKDSEIRTLLPKGELAYPLSQHIGAPANPIVKKGDHVLKGQKIAEAGGFVSSPIHASVSGTVKGIEYRFNPAGTKTECIIIENDGEYAEINDLTVKPFGEMTREEIIERIGEAGIVGMGGAGFPTRVKLSPKEPEKIEYIIANCAECEPYITADYRRMLENTGQLVNGMRIILSLFPNAKGIFAVEDNKKDCIEKLNNREIDIAFGLSNNFKNYPDLIYRTIYHSHVCVVTSLEHPLSHKEYVTIKDIKNEPLIVLSKKQGKEYYHDYMEAFRLDGMIPYIKKEVDDLNEYVMAISLGEGIGLSATEVISENDQVAVIPLKESHHHADYAVGYRQDNEKKAIQQFMKYVEDYFRL